MLKKIKKTLPWCWLLFCIACFLLFLHRNLITMLEADMASEMVLGYHIYQSGSFVPKSWYYGSELRLLNMPLIHAFLFSFIDSWHWVRLLSTAIAYGFLLLGFYYLCRQLNVHRYFPLAASCFFLPLSDIYAYIILIGNHYLPYAVMSFVILALSIHFSKASKKSTRLLLLVVLAVLSLISGMASLRMLLMLFFPLLFSAFLIRFCLREKSVLHQRMWLAALTAVFFAVSGYLFNSKVLSHIYRFTQFENVIFTDVKFTIFTQFLNYFLNHLGYRSGGMLFSAAALRAALCLLLLSLIGLAVYGCFQRKNAPVFSCTERLPILTYAMALLLFSLLVLATTTPYASNFLVPIVILTPITVVIVFANWRWSSTSRKLLACVLMLLVVFCGVDTCGTYNRGDDNTELQQIAASLVQDGYTDGYSTFWRGNLVTELADGKIDMRVWDTSDDMDISTVNPFLQLKSHETTVPQGKTFIILSKYFNEHTDIALATWLQPEDIYWDSKDYLVYGYESYDDLLSSVNQSCSSALDSRKVSPASSASLAPIPLYPGSYTVTITGEQLDGLQITCAHSEGSLVPVQSSLADGALTFCLKTDDLLHDVQINLQNAGAQFAVLESFHLQKDSSR